MENTIVTVNQGKLQGIRQQSKFSKKKYYSFYGVPYAEPPIGDLRFKSPQKIEPWRGIKAVYTQPECCIQFSIMKCCITGVEDCLYVNIFTANLPMENSSPSLKPVIVNIHPGGHVWGSPQTEIHGSPDFIIHHDIVYVGIGYRLHMLGFLNLNIPDCAGNMGLKDIIMAFEWIKDNIKFFGGDSNNITVMGTSSGAATIHLLLLSPRAKGLFHRAIVLGDYVFNCLVHYHEQSIDLAFKVANELGFKGKSMTKLLRFYKSLPADVIASAMKTAKDIFHLDNNKLHPYGPFLPTIDFGDDAVLPKSPRELLFTMEKVPLIVGFCEREAIFCFMTNQEALIRKHVEIYDKNCWSWVRTIDSEKQQEILKKIEDFYFNEFNLQKDDITSINMNIQTDAALSEVYDTLINPIAEIYPVYVYKFTYEGELNLLKEKFQKRAFKNLTGSYHADDYNYWACPIEPNLKKTIEKIQEYTTLLTNFAKTGIPNENLNISWTPTKVENPCYLEINEELREKYGKLNGERTEFWEDLKKNYGIFS